MNRPLAKSTIVLIISGLLAQVIWGKQIKRELQQYE